jgi:hypothetical protein
MERCHVGPRASVKVVAKSKTPTSTKNQTPDIQPIISHYTEILQLIEVMTSPLLNFTDFWTKVPFERMILTYTVISMHFK